MAAHTVDGLGLEYTSRTSWKARLYEAGALLGVVPVAWSNDFRVNRNTRKRYLRVWYKDHAELVEQMASDQPFVVALAEAKDPEAPAREFKRFVGVFRVKATGQRLGEQTIETEVLERLR